MLSASALKPPPDRHDYANLDALHSALFYALAALTLAGGLAVALLAGERRLLGLLAVGLGLAGLYADLSAGFAAGAAVLAYLACAALLLRTLRAWPALDAADREPRGVLQQAGGLLAGAVFLVLAYAAYRGDFAAGFQTSGEINTSAIGRLLLGRDAPAVEDPAGAFLGGDTGAAVTSRLL